jgi:Uncharacterised nucleotidyltransferase
MAPIDNLTAVLRACASIDLDERGQARLIAAASRVGDWVPLAERAEDHGLAPLVRRHVRNCHIALPPTVSTQLSALAVRHRKAGGALADALLDIVAAFRSARIEHVALKGAVLAHDIYPAPELRPLRDLDILVAPSAGPRAISLLQDLGFEPAAALIPWVRHHLPAVARRRSGYKVTVEVHEDAINYDHRERLTFATLTEPPRAMSFGGQSLNALGHTDMLRHLTAHLLEPRHETRLIGVVDLVGYAARYADDIDWERLARVYPRVTTALGLMEHLNPLPRVLQALAPALGSSTPGGVGFGPPMLASVALRARPGTVPVGALLYPSEWWMRAYYGIAAPRSLATTRWSRHVPLIVYRALRRYLAGPAYRAALIRQRLVSRRRRHEVGAP